MFPFETDYSLNTCLVTKKIVVTKECVLKLKLKKEKFEEMFPRLAEEMSKDDCKTKINSVRTDVTVAEKAVAKRFNGYNPDAIDFLRRCDTNQQAEEIICYLEKRQEITSEHAAKLRKQLKTKGVRSFGSKKDNDYYLRHDGF